MIGTYLEELNTNSNLPAPLYAPYPDAEALLRSNRFRPLKNMDYIFVSGENIVVFSPDKSTSALHITDIFISELRRPRFHVFGIEIGDELSKAQKEVLRHGFRERAEESGRITYIKGMVLVSFRRGFRSPDKVKDFSVQISSNVEIP